MCMAGRVVDMTENDPTDEISDIEGRIEALAGAAVAARGRLPCVRKLVETPATKHDNFPL
jgi:hypothetical protein